MNKYSLSNHIDPSLYTKYKIRQPGHIAQARTQFVDQNEMVDRLQSIRKKYSSKDKYIFTLRGEDNPKQKSREVLKEQSYERAKSNLNISEYNQIHKKHTSSAYMTQMKQRNQQSKQKVCQRVQNIQKINDKIKSILNKFEIQGPNKTHIAKRTNFNEQCNFKTTLKPKKVQVMQEQFRSQNSKQFKQYSTLLEHRASLRKLDNNIIHVSHNQSLNMTIDESFVIQKYNPSQAKTKSNQVLDFVSKLCGQISNDENLRTSKYLFLLNLKQNKYQKLQSQFQKRGAKYSLQQLTQQMRFAEEEYDPFMFESSHEDYGKYASSLLDANRYWSENINRKFSYKKLIKDGIQQALIADTKDNQFTVADFARFVNITSGNLYKNRDLVIIMRRITNGNLTFEKLFKAVCHDYQK